MVRSRWRDGGWGCIVFASIQRAYGAIVREEGGARFRGRVCGLQCGKMLPRKGCKCTGYPLGFGSAFAMHSMRALKRRTAERAGILFADTRRISARNHRQKRRKLAAAITLIYSDRSLSMRARRISSPQNGITCGKVSFYALEARHLAVARFICLFRFYIYLFSYILNF